MILRAMIGGPLLLALLALTAGCGTTPPAVDDAAAPPSFTDTDLRQLDWNLDRYLLAKNSLADLFRLRPPPDYRESLRYAAPADSLGLEEFLQLPGPSRRARRAAALEHHRRARFAVLYPLHLEIENQRSATGAHGRFQDAVIRALGHLVQATGLDPTDAAAWYDLAYLAGTVGDRPRQEQAIRTALSILQRVDDADEPYPLAMRRRLRLDLAWLARERGETASGHAQLDTLAVLHRQEPPPPRSERDEAVLVRGLLFADRGEWEGAQACAGCVTRTPVRKRIDREQILVPLALYPPPMGFIKSSWHTEESAFMADWILACLDRAQGRAELAVRRIGVPYVTVDHPPGLGHRYWQDLGAVFEASGDQERAGRCHFLARLYLPYVPFFAVRGYQGLGTVRGHSGAEGEYYVGPGGEYLAGSLFAFAGTEAYAWEVAEPDDDRQARRRRAEAALSACIARHQHRPAALALRGRLALLDGRTAEAADDLETAVAELPAERPVPETLLDLGTARLILGRDRAARSALAVVARLRPDDPGGHELLGVALARQGHHETALAELQRALDLAPGDASIWYNRGLVLLNAGQPAAAHAHLDSALARRPDDPRIQQMLAVAANLRDGPVELAVVPDRAALSPAERERIRQALRDGSAAPPSLAAGLDVLDEDARRAVLARLAVAYRESPTSAHRRDLAWAYLQAGEPAKVQELLAGDWSALDDESLIVLLRADRARGEAARAQELVAGLSRDPDLRPRGEVWAQVAVICLESGRREPARRALERARRLAPDNPMLARQLSSLGE